MTSLKKPRHETRIIAVSLVILTIIAVVTAAKLAQALVAPIVLGLVIAVIVSPVAGAMQRIGVHRAVSATCTLLVVALLIIALLVTIGPATTELGRYLPQIEREIQIWLDALVRMVGGFAMVERELEETLNSGGEEAVAAAVPGLINALWLAPNFVAQMLIFAGTLFFAVLTRDELYEALSSRQDKLLRADRAVSHYFLNVTMINAGMGLVVLVAMSLIGLPNPVIWGLAAFFLNFILYLGPLFMITALFVAGITLFSGPMILLPPLIFLMINIAEAQFVTPSVLGQRLNINPLIVFLAILFGLWLWGPVGGIVSLPFLVWVGGYFGWFRSEPTVQA